MPIARPRRATCVALAAAVVLARPAAAQQPAATPVANTNTHTLPVPSVGAKPRVGTIVIDGRPTEEAWAAAQPVTDFKQIDPDEGKAGSERTEFRILYDADALYVSARMWDANGPKGIATQLARRDNFGDSDYAEVAIDSYHNHLNRYFFQVNPSGVRYDAQDGDGSWDPVWEVASHVDSTGWSMEMRIPYSQLRFSRDPQQTWGLQLRRYIQRRHELQQWSFWRKNESGGPSRFGHLEGIEPGPQSRHWEATPYVVSRERFIRPSTPNDPFNDGSRADYRFGGDLKASLTSNLRLDLTVNPDFGQVEVDPAEVNLSAFETFFSEKRPFFVENSGLFDFGYFSCNFCSNVSSIESFYSRRIGRAPQLGGLALGGAPFADVPENSTILGAAKITGRTSAGLNVGILNAVTRREVATLQDASGLRTKLPVEPFTNYFVGRAQKEYRQGNLVLGGIATSVARKLDTQEFRDRLDSHSEMAGVDLALNWDQRKYSFLFTGAASNIAGSPSAILRAQRSSARYYQRPDRKFDKSDFLSGRYDPTATGLTGAAAYARLAKETGDWTWEGMVNTRTPGYEVNDIGFLSRADYVWTNVNVNRQWTQPGSWYRSIFTILGSQNQTNWDGDLTDRDYHAFFQTQTPQFWNVSTFAILHPQLLDDRLLRGGPVAARPGDQIYNLNVSTDSRKPIVFSNGYQVSRTTEGGFGSRLNVSARMRPRSNVQVSLGPSYSLNGSKQQFVTSLDDPTSTAFYGRRYVFSSLTQKTLSLNTRLAVTFTPTTTLELFAQPFLASGDYYDFKEFDRPRALAKSVYGRDRGTVAATKNSSGAVTGYTIDPDGAGTAAPFSIGNPDFNVRALRGNAVFRWEYRPGSTLFVVWTQSRDDAADVGVGDLDFSRDRTALFGAHPDNIFLVKLNYWFGR